MSMEMGPIVTREFIAAERQERRPRVVITMGGQDASMTAVTPEPRSPALESLRLLSDGRSSALLGPAAEVHWWCRPRFDSPPICWSLLDPRGGTARWLDASHAGSDGEPAGPTTRTLLRVGFTGRVEVWDGLVASE